MNTNTNTNTKENTLIAIGEDIAYDVEALRRARSIYCDPAEVGMLRCTLTPLDVPVENGTKHLIYTVFTPSLRADDGRRAGLHWQESLKKMLKEHFGYDGEVKVYDSFESVHEVAGPITEVTWVAYGINTHTNRMTIEDESTDPAIFWGEAERT